MNLEIFNFLSAHIPVWPFCLVHLLSTMWKFVFGLPYSINKDSNKINNLKTTKQKAKKQYTKIYILILYIHCTFACIIMTQHFIV